MRRKPFISGNWKMFKTVDEAVETAKSLVSVVSGQNARDIMIAPPYTDLFPVYQEIKNTNVALGGQNLHFEKQGAFTGEISADMLLSCGCKYVIIGHSERRQFFGETDETVNRRISMALESGLIPVVCIGENESEREEGKTNSILDKQMKNGLKDIVVKNGQELIIAYEPVWAIGTGKTATPEIAEESHAFIRETIQGVFGEEFAQSTRIIYGGSVKPGNTAELMAMPDIDGALVGGASLEAQSFAEIVNYTEKS